MKKYLIAFSLLLFTTTTFANITIKGVLSDGLDSAKKLKGVAITLDGVTQRPSKDEGIFIIPDIPNADNVEIVFTHPDATAYYPIRGFLNSDDNFAGFSLASNGSDGLSGSSILTEDKTASTKTFILNLDMFPIKKDVFAGIVYKEDSDGNNKESAKDVAITISGEHSEYFDINNGSNKTDAQGEFSVTGYKFAEAKEYTLNFSLAGFKDETQEITIQEGKDNKPKKDLEIVFKKITGKKARENNLQGITGFGCDETMPKYLIGANCEENSNLEGDATDLAALIQKFGGKITGMISMIAVLLIVWNAFNIVTAAGEETKISEGKKGIMWTILGLAVTMFAYIIVKTVIMLAYTS